MTRRLLVWCAVLGLLLVPVSASAQTFLNVGTILSCTAGQVPVNGGGGVTDWSCGTTTGTGTWIGSGTSGTVPIANGAASLTNSLITAVGSTYTMTGTWNVTTGYNLNGASLNTGGTLTNVLYKDYGNGGTYFSMGTTPATAGIVRIPYAQSVVARNSSNTDNAILIDNRTLSAVTDTIMIGDGGQQQVVVNGSELSIPAATDPLYIANATATTGTALIWSATGAVRPQSSSARYKEHVAPWIVPPGLLAKFVALSPKSWDYKGQRNGAAGFISEDLNALGLLNAYGTSPLVNYDQDGRADSNRDFALIGLQHLVLQDHEARLAQLESRANINRPFLVVTPANIDQITRAAKVEADAAMPLTVRQARMAQRFEQCRSDSADSEAQGGRPLDCTPDAEALAVAKEMRDASVKAAADQKAQALAECARKNAVIVRQGGTPLACVAQ